MAGNKRMRESGRARESGKVRESGRVRESGKVRESGRVRESGKVRESEKARESGRVRESEKVRESSRVRESGRMRKKKKENITNHMALVGITLVVLSLAITVHFSGISLKKKDLTYKIKEEQLSEQVAYEEKRAEELEEYRLYVQTKQYIEKVAKEKLGLVNKDEILLKPSEKK